MTVRLLPRAQSSVSFSRKYFGLLLLLVFLPLLIELVWDFKKLTLPEQVVQSSSIHKKNVSISATTSAGDQNVILSASKSGRHNFFTGLQMDPPLADIDSVDSHNEAGIGLISPADQNQNSKKNPFQRIILMGHFNFDALPNAVMLRWQRKMEQIFAKVVIRGELWNQTRVQELRQLGMDVQPADDSLRRNELGSLEIPGQTGFFTPLNNLRQVLIEYQNWTDMYDGVLYMHDDSIPNLAVLAMELTNSSDLTKTVLGTDLGKLGMRMSGIDRSYEDPRESVVGKSDVWIDSMSKATYRIYPRNKTHPFTDYHGEKAFPSAKALDSSILDGWNMRLSWDGRCILGQYKMAMDPASQKFYEGSPNNPYMTFPSYTQADNVYIPLRFTNVFSELAVLLEKHGVWIECAFGTIVDQLRLRYNASVIVTPLCTNWNRFRGKTSMVWKCAREEGAMFHGFYHPVKAGTNVTDWEMTFDKVNENYLRSIGI